MRLFQYQTKVEPLQPVVGAVTPLSWLGSAVVPLPPKVVPIARIAPSLFFVQTVVPAVVDAKWLTSYPARIDSVKRQQYLYPSVFVDTKQLTLPEVNVLTKWLGSRPDRINPVPRNMALYPSFFFNGDPSTYNPLFPPNGNTCEPLTNWAKPAVATADWALSSGNTNYWANSGEKISDKVYNSSTRTYNSSTLTYNGNETDSSGTANWTSGCT